MSWCLDRRFAEAAHSGAVTAWAATAVVWLVVAVQALVRWMVSDGFGLEVGSYRYRANFHHLEAGDFLPGGESSALYEPILQ